MRPSWDDVWSEMAQSIARRSRCVRSAVGCVIVTSHNRVAAVGYNGPPRGLKLAGETCDHWCPRVLTGGAPASYDDCYTSHAEMNALVIADATACQSATMYITRVPCFTCAKVIANSGVCRVVFPIADEDIAREPMRSVTLLEESGLSVVITRG